jgi:3-hydroxybutyryl-CoA dehydrogenase
MGAGIAQACAQAGYTVILYDPYLETLRKAEVNIQNSLRSVTEKGKLTQSQAAEIGQRITYYHTLTGDEIHLVIEAIPEKYDLKFAFFKELEALCDSRTILTTNTSSLSVSKLASQLQYPERFAGLHFFNPATILKLVEVVSGESTAPDIPNLLSAFCLKIGKTPALVRDIPGFIVNRVARFYYLESLRLAEPGNVPYAQIDRLMESTGFRMGPFKLMDLIGMDTNHSVTSSLYEAFLHEPRFRPSPLQQRKVDSGQLGRKRGIGFYEYPS